MPKKQETVDRWNARYPIGTEVTVTRDCGEMVETKTRSRAELLGGHTPVIWLEEISGCYLLDRVKASRPMTSLVPENKR